MNKYTALILGTVLALTSPAFAEGEHSHQASTAAKSSRAAITIWKSSPRTAPRSLSRADDGDAEDVKDAKAKATILSEGQKQEIELVPDPANFLRGTGSFKATKGTTIVVTLTMPGHKPEQARVKLD